MRRASKVLCQVGGGVLHGRRHHDDEDGQRRGVSVRRHVLFCGDPCTRPSPYAFSVLLCGLRWATHYRQLAAHFHLISVISSLCDMVCSVSNPCIWWYPFSVHWKYEFQSLVVLLLYLLVYWIPFSGAYLPCFVIPFLQDVGMLRYSWGYL